MKRITSDFFYCVMLSVLLCSCAISAQEDISSHSLLHNLETDSGYATVWEKDDYWIDRNEAMPKIIGSSGMFLLERRNGAYQKLFIAGVDSLTGATIWEKTVHGNMPGEILVADKLLLRGSYGAAKIDAYNITTGKVVWGTALPKAHSTFSMYYENNKIFIFTVDDEFFILDETGSIVSSSHKPFRTYLVVDGVQYEKEFSAIRAIDVKLDTEIWHLDIEKEFREAPVFDNGTIFLRTRFIPNYVYSINQATGEINWKVSQDVLSNLFVTAEKIYFLSYGSELVSLDRHSGEEILRDKFSPPFDLDKQNGGYFVAGDPTNDVLAIAFGDNTQIMGLKILNP